MTSWTEGRYKGAKSETHMQVQLTSNQPNMHDANIGMGMGWALRKVGRVLRLVAHRDTSRGLSRARTRELVLKPTASHLNQGPDYLCSTLMSDINTVAVMGYPVL